MAAHPSGRGQRLLAWAWTPLCLTALVALIAVVASTASVPVQRTVAEALIDLVAVVALYIFVGNSGLLSFGHTAFMAIAAYVSAWLTMPGNIKSVMLPDLPAFLAHAHVHPLAAALIGGAVAAVFATVVGWPLMRLSGISASIATFAMLSIVYLVFGNWTALTGGQNSLIGLPIYTDIWIGLVTATAAIWAAWIYQNSHFGLALRASREDEIAARALAVNVIRQRLIAFVVSAFFAGLGGVLLGHFLGTLRIESFYLDLTFLTFAMLVVGGMGSLTGAVAGVITITALSEGLRQLETGVAVGGATVSVPPGVAEVVLALVMLLTLIFRPRGLAGGRELPFPTVPRSTRKRKVAA
jgi:branched-chain amino acid transport system permease protein